MLLIVQAEEEGRPGKVRRPSREVADARLKLCELFVSIAQFLKGNWPQREAATTQRL
jgi:hypothetical protein